MITVENKMTQKHAANGAEDQPDHQASLVEKGK